MLVPKGDIAFDLQRKVDHDVKIKMATDQTVYNTQWAQAWKLAKNHYSLISLKLLYHVIDIFLDSKLFTE